MKANSFTQTTAGDVGDFEENKPRGLFDSGCKQIGKYVWKEKEILSEHEEHEPGIMIFIYGCGRENRFAH